MIVEDPRIAVSPDPKEFIVPDKMYIEYFAKDKDFFVHVYKPVEKKVRKEEKKIRDTGIVPWPDYKDPKKASLQDGIRARIDKCEARRQAWREMPIAKWPDIGEKLKEAVIESGLGNFDGIIDYIKEADSWSIVLNGAYRIPESKQDKLISMIDDKVSDLLDWPEEENA